MELRILNEAINPLVYNYIINTDVAISGTFPNNEEIEILTPNNKNGIKAHNFNELTEIPTNPIGKHLFTIGLKQSKDDSLAKIVEDAKTFGMPQQIEMVEFNGLSGTDLELFFKEPTCPFQVSFVATEDGCYLQGFIPKNDIYGKVNYLNYFGLIELDDTSEQSKTDIDNPIELYISKKAKFVIRTLVQDQDATQEDIDNGESRPVYVKSQEFEQHLNFYYCSDLNNITEERRDFINLSVNRNNNINQNFTLYEVQEEITFLSPQTDYLNADSSNPEGKIEAESIIADKDSQEWYFDVLANDTYIGSEKEVQLQTDIPEVAIVEVKATLKRFDGSVQTYTDVSDSFNAKVIIESDDVNDIPIVQVQMLKELLGKHGSFSDNKDSTHKQPDTIEFRVKYEVKQIDNGQYIFGYSYIKGTIEGRQDSPKLREDAVFLQSDSGTISGNVFDNDTIDSSSPPQVKKWHIPTIGDVIPTTIETIQNVTIRLFANGNYTLEVQGEIDNDIIPDIQYFYDDQNGNTHQNILRVDVRSWAVWTEDIQPNKYNPVTDDKIRENYPSRPTNATGLNREDIYQVGADDQTKGKHNFSGNTPIEVSGQFVPICKFHRAGDLNREGKLPLKEKGDLIEASDVNVLKQKIEIQLQMFKENPVNPRNIGNNLIQIEKDQTIMDWDDITIPPHRRKLIQQDGYPIVKPEEFRRLQQALRAYIGSLELIALNSSTYIDRDTLNNINNFKLSQESTELGTKDDPKTGLWDFEANTGTIIKVGFYNTLVEAYNMMLTSCICNTDCGCNAVCVCNLNCGCNYGSDKNIKNIQPSEAKCIEDIQSLHKKYKEILELLKPKMWEYNDKVKSKYGGGMMFGPIAQNVQEALVKMNKIHPNLSIGSQIVSETIYHEGLNNSFTHLTVDYTLVQELREYVRNEISICYDRLAETY